MVYIAPKFLHIMCVMLDPYFYLVLTKIIIVLLARWMLAEYA